MAKTDSFQSRVEDELKRLAMGRYDVMRRGAKRTGERKENMESLYASESRKRASGKPLPPSDDVEQEDILRPKNPAKGTGAMLRKGQSFNEAMSLDEPTTPKAKVVAEDELVQSFFAKAHGGSYDPNSRVDKAKMQKILGMVNAQPDLLSLTPGKFAVKLYASK